MEDAIKKAMELERRTQALRVSQRDLTVQFAEGRAQIKEYNMIAEDTTRGLEERLEAAQKAIDIERELMAARQAQAQEEFDIAKERAAQSDSSEDDLDNLAQLEANLINIRTESAEMQTTLNNKLNIIRQQAKAAAKAEADAIALAEQEKQDAYEATLKARRESINQINEAADQARTYTMTQQEAELDALEQQFMKLEEAQLDYIDQVEENEAMYQEGELARAETHLEEMETRYYAKEAAIVEKYKKQEEDKVTEANDKIEASERAKAEAIKAANIGLIQAGFQALNAMAKTEEGQKKLAIAQILVNQGIALSNAIAGAQASALATGPGAVFSAPGFTATLVGLVLSSFAQIKGIMNQAGAATEGLDTAMPSLGGGGGGSASGGGGPQLAMTPDLAQSFNDALGSQAIQAYVVQQDLADANALQESIANQASLGGG
jgi:chemotaxis protein histidine kinase CheA